MPEPDDPQVAPRLSQLNLVVGDMEAMATFYSHLGIRLTESPPEWQPHHRNGEVEGGMRLDLDSTAFASSWNRGWPAGRAGVVIGFDVDSAEEVDRLHHHLTSLGYPSQQPPYDAFWGARFAAVADPDGNSVGIMSPIDPVRASPPPDPPG